MNKVIEKIGAQKQGIYFGDSKSDMEAAGQFGLVFIFVRGVLEWEEGNNLLRGNLDHSIQDYESSDIFAGF